MFQMQNPIEIRLKTTKKSQKKFERLKAKIEKQIQEHQKEFSQYKITVNIKKKTWIRKIKIFMIALLFSYRLRKIQQRVQYFGVSNIVINPNFRDLEYLIKQTETLQLYQKQKIQYTAKKRLLYPNSIKMFFWKFVIFVSISIYLIIYPLYINFKIKNMFLITTLFFVDFAYFLDFLIGFNLTYKQPKNKFQQNRKKIVINYLKNDFIINLFTSIPFFALSNHKQIYHDINQNLKLTNFSLVLQFLKMLKVLQLKKLFNNNLLPYNIRFQIRINEYKIHTFCVIYITFMILHVFACFFIKISLIQSLEPHTWLYSQELIFEDQIKIYLSSLYYCFVVLTTVGFGDIVSQNNLERIFTLFWMLFGVAFYSFTVGYITNFFTLRETQKSLLAEKIKKFDKFASEKQVDQSLQDKIRLGLKHSSKQICYRWIKDDINIITCMPKYQKYLFLRSIHSDLFKCKLFSTNNFYFSIRMIELLKPLKIKKGEFLWTKDDYAKFICFVTKGKLFLMTNNIYAQTIKQKKQRKSQIIKNSIKKIQSILMFWRQNQKVCSKTNLRNLKKGIQKNQIKNNVSNCQAKNLTELQQTSLIAIKIFSEGAYIGEEEIIQNCKRHYWIKAGTDTELMVLSREDFENVFKVEFPHDYNNLIEDAIKKVKDQQQCKIMLFKNLQKLFQKYKKSIRKESISQQNTIHKPNLKKFQKNKKIYKDIKQFYQQEEIKTNFEETFFDIKIQEYVKEDEEIFQGINTPGFQKLFQEMTRLRIKLNDENDTFESKNTLDKIKDEIRIDLYRDKKNIDTGKEKVIQYAENIENVFNLIQENKKNIQEIQNNLQNQLVNNRVDQQEV